MSVKQWIRPPAKKVLQAYQRYQKYAPVAFFWGGFAWDSLTLTRIDRLSDNLILLGYILLLGILIFLVNLAENGRLRRLILIKYQEWYPLGIQFFLGGLFSSYVVFYFQSASLTKTSLFVGILALLLIANEFLEKRLTNFYLQMSLYFLVNFSFFIFFIPVISKRMDTFTFFSGVVLSLLLTGGMIIVFYRKLKILARHQFLKSIGLIILLMLLLNLIYWRNWIPPVPLSLKYGGIYHHVSRRTDQYLLKYEKPPWHHFWKKSDNPFRHAAGDTVFCFASVFAPTRLTKKIYHHWQHYLPEKKTWITTDRLGYDVTGGREGGYRGYTYKKHIQPGKWRVDVETEEKLLLGRIQFTIFEVEHPVKAFKFIYQ